MIKHFLSIANIDKIDLYMAGIEVQIYHYLVSHISKRHLNVLRNILYIQKSAIGQLVILNKSIII